jgi:hypothetical protein
VVATLYIYLSFRAKQDFSAAWLMSHIVWNLARRSKLTLRTFS